MNPIDWPQSLKLENSVGQNLERKMIEDLKFVSAIKYEKEIFFITSNLVWQEQLFASLCIN